MKIGFIGLGKLGLPCAEVFSEKGFDVYGYDIDFKKSDSIHICSSIQEVCNLSEIIFISVPTPHDKNYDGSIPCVHLEPKDFDYSIVKKCLKEINLYANKDHIIVLISTVLPGTITEQLSNLVPNKTLIYNPYLIAMGSVSWDMKNPEMILLGTKIKDKENNEKIKLIIELYKNIVENTPEIVIGTWEEIESIKIFYNTFISMKISFVNTIQDVAEKQGNMNVDFVTKSLCKGSTRILSEQYMKSGMGDGGPCHPRDNIALRYLSKKLNLGYDLFENIINIREKQAKNIAKKLVSLSEDYNMPIIIHGKSYKPNVPYTDGSYSILVGHYCEEMGKKVTYIDKYSDKLKLTNPSVFLLAHNSKVTYKYLSNNRQDEFYCKIPEKSVILDPWRTFHSNKHTVIHYGYNIK